MAAPTLLDYAQSTWTDVNTTDVTADLDWNASGDLILVLGATEDNGVTMATPTGTGITLAALTGLPSNTGSSCKVYGWKATAAGNGNTVLTTTNAGGDARGLAAWAFSGSDGIENPVVDVSTGVTVNVAVQQADSQVCMVLADWNATTDVTVTTVPAGGTVRQINTVSGLATFAVVEWTAQATGTRAYGLSAWTGTGTVSKAAVEVRGSGTSPGAVTLTPATAALTGVALTATPVAPTVALTPASIAGQAVALSPAAAPVTVSLTPRTLTLAPVPIAAAPVVTLTPVALNLAPRLLTLTATAALTAVSATLAPVALGLGSAGAVTLTPAVAALSARLLTLTPVHVLVPAALALSARPLTPVPGAVTLALTPAAIALTARPLTPAAIVAGAVALTPALLTFAGVPLLIGSQNEPGSIASSVRGTAQLTSERRTSGELSSTVAPMGAFSNGEQSGGIA